MAAAYNNRAVAWEKQGKPMAALADYSRALSADPRYSLALRNRAALEIRLRLLGLAIRDYREAAAIRPDDVAALRGQAYVEMRLGDLDRSMASLDAAMRFRPDDAAVQFDRAMVYSYTAREHSTGHLIDGQVPTQFMGVAPQTARELRDDWYQVVDACGDAIRIDPSRTAAYALRAEAYHALGHESAAQRDRAAARRRGWQ